jgi:nicotinate-nucleotide pyrophosphorylase (carboxylating)
MLEQEIKNNVATALHEDVGTGDITAGLLPHNAQASASILCRQQAVICGQAWVNECFRQIDASIATEWLVNEGDVVDTNTVVCRINGPAQRLLTAERTALNFLQTLSATATVTRQHVDVIAGTSTRILDTRKTIPGLRLAQKYAVRCGGGHNHRIGLFDAMLIKENHIRAAGSIAAALEQAAASSGGKEIKIEIEVESLNELQQALTAGARFVLLDNFTVEQLVQAVALNQGQANLEASGNINLNTIRSIAETGINDISIGGLTKHIDAIDFSMLFDLEQ